MGFFTDLIKAPLQLAAGVGQIGVGVAQGLRARKMEYPELEGYDIPEEYLQNMTDAQIQSFIGLPEAQKREFTENIQRSGMTALQQVGSRKGGLGLISSIQQQQQDAYKSLLSADATARQKNLDRFFQAREAMGVQETMKQQRDFDVTDKKRELKEVMQGAAMQNIASGFGAMAGIETGGFGNRESVTFS
jgi:hypothetical protein